MQNWYCKPRVFTLKEWHCQFYLNALLPPQVSMPPLRCWMTRVLQIVAALSVGSGLAIALLRREIFQLLKQPQPTVPLPMQIAGVLLAVLGVGLWLAVRRPYENRVIVLLCSVANALLVFAWAYSLIRQKVPSFCAPIVLVHFALFVLLGLIARELYRVTITSEASEIAVLSRRKSFLSHFAFATLLLAVFVPTVWSTLPGFSQLHRWWATPEPLKLRFVQVNLPASVTPVTPLMTENAFPHLKFTDPTSITALPDGSRQVLVTERPGRIRKFLNSPDATETTLFLDITDRVIDVRNMGEDGLSSIALHPQFAVPDSPHRGKLFVHYTSMIDGIRALRISMFRVPLGSDVADPNSEVVLIHQPDENPSHNGGSVLFGPDGFLYVTIGDDDVRHPNPHAQHIDRDLFSGVLRIDVDCQGGDASHAPPRQPNTGRTANYFIPNDNPFVGTPNALEEFYAIGFRNPWRASFDRKTDKLWVSDVGERRREEVSIVENGSNCGWAYVEGSVRSNSHDSAALDKPEPYLGKETWPVYEYERSALDRCIIGGFVYRGVQFPELTGKYVYADTSGRLYAITVDKQSKFVSNDLISIVDDFGHRVVSFGENLDGELFMCVIKQLNAATGEIHRFVRTPNDPRRKLPSKLSETGLFADVRTLHPVTSLVAYDVISPLWSDRATKSRWIGLPKVHKIGGEWNGPWKFPVGTVFVKHFDLPLDERDASNSEKQRRLETRVLVCDDQGSVYGASYRWNEDATDAHIVDDSQTETIPYTDATGKSREQEWFYPGRFECITCHNPMANHVLGFTAKQLNRDISVGWRKQNQLERFAQAGMFDMRLEDQQLAEMPRLAAIDDPHATVEHRVRSYLDSNCSHCHRPHTNSGRWDGRFERDLASLRMIDEVAIFHKIADPLAKVVRAGDLEHSYMWKRMTSNNPIMRMPPLGRNVVDEKAADLVAEWIKSLPPSVDPATPMIAEEADMGKTEKR